MNDSSRKIAGYVYILEVKDIVLPVCKIGMTTRDPYQRCAEINQSSTGDFLWEVAAYFRVDDCRALERLVHQKLSPLRQKRREFFNLTPEDAYVAIRSILDNQTEISWIEENNDGSRAPDDSTSVIRPSERKKDLRYTHLLFAFNEVLGLKGKPFGQLNRPHFGVSDGRLGVQWNVSIQRDTGEVHLGVNLEGSEKTGRWLISDFILNAPDITVLKQRVADPDRVIVRFARDAWQAAARLEIREALLGGKEFPLSQMDRDLWTNILNEALSCLDSKRNFRARNPGQPVTRVSDGLSVVRPVSPHLTIWTPIDPEGDPHQTIREGITLLQPVHDWVTEACNRQA